MRIKDEAMFMRKSGGANPVMDGLVMWYDARDELVDTIVQKYYDDKYFEATMVDRVSGIRATHRDPNYQRVLLQEDGLFYHVFSRVEYGNEVAGSFDGYVDGVKTVEIVRNVGLDPQGTVLFGLKSWYSGGSVRLYNYPASPPNHIWTGYVQPLNTVEHIVCIIDNNYCDLYVNGEYKTKTKVNVDFLRFDSTSSFSLVAPGGAPAQVVYSIGSVKAYNRILTPEEIQQNYNYEKSLGRVD